MPYSFTAPLWLDDNETWHFVTVPAELSDEIDERTAGLQGGFGSVRVEVTVGGTTWGTSVFPSKQVGSYVLPVKKAVRLAEGLEPGAPLTVSLRVVGLDD